MKKSLLFSFNLLTLSVLCAQFAGPVGTPVSTAIKADSNIFVDWASECTINRGYLDIREGGNMKATLGEGYNATGKADGAVVSLGDSGVATLMFSKYVLNGPGWDFAVFENSFSDEFLELALVEVSSDGKRIVRFSATSLTQDTVQIGAFDLKGKAQWLNNLAGKYRGGWGTPFDLDELKDSAGLDVNAIRYIRLIDVVGSINDSFATRDAQGRKINDPFPTPFSSCGFDLDAVGVRHSTARISAINLSKMAWPNPVSETIYLDKRWQGAKLYTLTGEQVTLSHKEEINVSQLLPGIYMLRGLLDGQMQSTKIVVSH